MWAYTQCVRTCARTYCTSETLQYRVRGMTMTWIKSIPGFIPDYKKTLNSEFMWGHLRGEAGLGWSLGGTLVPTTAIKSNWWQPKISSIETISRRNRKTRAGWKIKPKKTGLGSISRRTRKKFGPKKKSCYRHRLLIPFDDVIVTASRQSFWLRLRSKHHSCCQLP